MSAPKLRTSFSWGTIKARAKEAASVGLRSYLPVRSSNRTVGEPPEAFRIFLFTLLSSASNWSLNFPRRASIRVSKERELISISPLTCNSRVASEMISATVSRTSRLKRGLPSFSTMTSSYFIFKRRNFDRTHKSF